MGVWDAVRKILVKRICGASEADMADVFTVASVLGFPDGPFATLSTPGFLTSFASFLMRAFFALAGAETAADVDVPVAALAILRDDRLGVSAGASVCSDFRLTMLSSQPSGLWPLIQQCLVLTYAMFPDLC